MRVEDLFTILCVFFLTGIWLAAWALLRRRGSPPPAPATERREAA